MDTLEPIFNKEGHPVYGISREGELIRQVINDMAQMIRAKVKLYLEEELKQKLCKKIMELEKELQKLIEELNDPRRLEEYRNENSVA